MRMILGFVLGLLCAAWWAPVVRAVATAPARVSVTATAASSTASPLARCTAVCERPEWMSSVAADGGTSCVEDCVEMEYYERCLGTLSPEEIEMSRNMNEGPTGGCRNEARRLADKLVRSP